jgi:hypothetical protein
MADAGPAVLVSANAAGVKEPEVAATEYCPEVVVAVKTVAVTTPEPDATTEVVSVPFANVPLAPVAGAANVTVGPVSTGLLFASSTVAVNCVAKAVPTVAD